MRDERRGIERITYRLYDRFGSRVLLIGLASAVVVAVFQGLVTAIWESRYLQLSPSEFWLIIAVGIPPVATASLAGVLASREVLTRILSWSGARRSALHAPATWRACVAGPGILMRRAALASSAGFAIAIVATLLVLDQPAWVASLLAFVSVVTAATAFTLIRFGMDLVLRPMVEDVSRFLPPEFEPPTRPGQLQLKAVVALPVVAAFTALTTGAFMDVSAAGSTRLAVALAISALTVVGTGAIFLVVIRSLLGPLDDLVAATNRVRHNDLETKVPITTNDDLGRLAESFNRMLDELKSQQEELVASRLRIIEASDAERRRVERNLHDGAQQRLVALALDLQLLEERIQEIEHEEGLLAMAERARSTLTEALTELRELARGLHPPVLATDGLPPALEQLASRAPIPVSLRASPTRFSEAVESTAYFVAAEALTNVTKYAQASHAEVTVERRNGKLVIEVADDGVGGADPASGTGLTGLADRVAALDGELVIESPPGGGTNVRAELPIAEEMTR